MAKTKLIFLVLLLCIFIAEFGSFIKADFPQSATAYYPQNNTCFTEANNFQITTYNCKAHDVDGRDITQYVTFEWKGGVELDTKWVFAYSGNLTSGSLYGWSNTSYQGYDPVNKTANLTIYDVVSHTSAGTPSVELCQIGNQWNDYAYNVTFLNGTSEVYCFSQFGQLNSTTYWLKGTYDGLQNATKYRMVWNDITSNVEYAGYNLLGNGHSFYYVKQAVFQPNERLETKWTFTPENAVQSGKWHIFGWKAGQSLQQAIVNNQYIYQDPWWNNSYTYRYKIISNATVEIPISINGTWGLNATAGTPSIIWTINRTEMYVYSTNSPSVGLIAIANSTVELPWENETSNTSNNIGALWADYMSVYHFSNIGDSSLAEDSLDNYSMVAVGGWNTTDPKFGAYSFYIDGANDYLKHTTLFDTFPYNGTMQFWFKPEQNWDDSMTDHNTFVNKESDANDFIQFIFRNKDDASRKGKICYRIYHSDVDDWACSTQASWSAGTWYHIAATWGSNGMFLYVNGVQEGTNAYTGGLQDGTQSDFYVGTNVNVNPVMSQPHTFDELRISNKQLSGTEIQQIYWNGINNLTSLGSEEIVSIGVVITVIQPWNITYGNNTIDFNITADTPLTWARVQLLGTNHTMVNQSGQWQYSNNTLSDGSYNAIFWVNSTTDKRDEANVWFTIDTTPPAITIIQPFNVTYVNISIDFNITLNEVGSSCLVQLLGTNHTMLNQSGQWQYSNDTLTDGTYEAVFFCSDIIGNTNRTGRWFTISAPPVLTMVSPVNITYYQNSTIPLKWYSSQAVNWSAYSLNDASNVTIVGNTTFTAQSGSNHIILWANDSFGNMGSAEVWFTFNATYPWWNSSWKFRKAINITTTTPKTHVQVNLNIPYELNMSPDFSDVRFLSDCLSNPVLLNAWNETMVENTSLKVWLNLTTYGTNHTYCMYYGNPDAQAYWDGKATLLYFQDFNSLNDGDIDGQDGWSYRLKEDASSINVSSYDNCIEGSKCLRKVMDTAGTEQAWRMINTTPNQNMTLFWHVSTLVYGSDISITMYSRNPWSKDPVGDYIFTDSMWSSNVYAPFDYIKAGFGDNPNQMSANWTGFAQWVNDTWYEINFTLYDQQHFEMCARNSTWRACRSGYNFYNTRGFPTHLSLNEGGTGGSGIAMWDMVYAANYTVDNLVYALGSEEEITVLPISIGNISVQSPVNPLENSTVQAEAFVNVTGDGFDIGNCSIYNPNGSLKSWEFAVETVINSTFTSLNCSFDMFYHYINGTYNIIVDVNNTIGDTDQANASFVYNLLSAFALNETVLNFGTLNIGQSSVVAFNLTNTGNQELIFEINGTDMVGAQDIIGVSNFTYDDIQGMPSPTTMSTSFQSFTVLSVLEIATGWINLTIPIVSFPEAYTGNITVKG